MPEQIGVGITFAIKGFGLTSTVTVKSAPTQVPEVGVTVYNNVAGDDVVLVRV